MMYVSASRAKKSVHVYTDDKQAVKAAIQASSQKYAALDLTPAEPLSATPKSATPKRDWRKDDADHRRRLDDWQRFELARLAALALAGLYQAGPHQARPVAPHPTELIHERDSSRGR